MRNTSDETTPVRTRAEPAETDFLLKPYGGERPAAPGWFKRAVAAPVSTGETRVDGAVIRWREWGDHSKPGLLLAHGTGAHAHW